MSYSSAVLTNPVQFLLFHLDFRYRLGRRSRIFALDVFALHSNELEVILGSSCKSRFFKHHSTSSLEKSMKLSLSLSLPLEVDDLLVFEEFEIVSMLARS